jgi:hypothetical protein
MFSRSQIKKIEEYYNINLPAAYKIVLFIVGEKIINFLQKQSQPINDSEPLSIYKIQTEMKVSEDDPACDEPELVNRLSNVFFLTNFVSYKNQELVNISYFIDLQGQENRPVYGWIYHNGYDANSIEKISDTIEEWLSQLSFTIYVEYQMKKIFCDISFTD